MANNRILKWMLVAMLVGSVGAFFFFDLGRFLTLENLKDSQASFQDLFEKHPAWTLGSYILIYVVSTALSLPGAMVLTLAGGALFGFGIGLVAVSFASTIGATLAFLAARFILKDYVESRFSEKIRSFQEGFAKEGGAYLFALRLVPIFPFFVVNLAMGITSIKVWTYFWVSQVGMLAGTAAYVNAGTQVAKVKSLSGLLSWQILLSFAVIGVLPLVSKKLLGLIRSKSPIESPGTPTENGESQ